MAFDVFYSTILESRNYIKTVGDKDTAANMCLANNKNLSRMEMSIGMGNMFFEEIL